MKLPVKILQIHKMNKTAVFYMALLFVGLGIVLLTEPTVKIKKYFTIKTICTTSQFLNCLSIQFSNILSFLLLCRLPSHVKLGRISSIVTMHTLVFPTAVTGTGFSDAVHNRMIKAVVKGKLIMFLNNFEYLKFFNLKTVPIK